MMISNRTLKYGEILAVCWSLAYGVAGILVIINSDGVQVPTLGWLCLGAMLIGSIFVHYIRKEKRRRDHEEFLQRHHQLRSFY